MSIFIKQAWKISWVAKSSLIAIRQFSLVPRTCREPWKNFQKCNEKSLINFFTLLICHLPFWRYQLKTTLKPCPTAHTHIGQKRKCPPPPPVWGHGKLMAVILDFYLHDKIRGSPEWLILEWGHSISMYFSVFVYMITEQHFVPV